MKNVTKARWINNDAEIEMVKAIFKEMSFD